MFAKTNTSETKQEFLDSAKAHRQQRERERHHSQSAIKIQAVVRGFLIRRSIQNEIRKDFDELMGELLDGNDDNVIKYVNAIKIYELIRRFMFVFDADKDGKRFERMSKYIIATMLLAADNNHQSPELESRQITYISVVFNKQLAVHWIQQLKTILWKCCQYLKHLKSELPHDYKQIQLYLNMLITFTSTNSWIVLKQYPQIYDPLRPVVNQLCNNVMTSLVTKGLYANLQILLIKGLMRTKPTLKKPALTAIITLALRPVIASKFNESHMNMFLLHIFSIPALVYHLNTISIDTLTVLSNEQILKRSVEILSLDQNSRILFNALEGNYALCLLANIIHLAYIEIPLNTMAANMVDFICVITKLLESCQKYVVSKQSSLTHWHPVLGWFAQNVDQGLHESLGYVKSQLQYLWSSQLIQLIFSPLFELCDKTRSQCRRDSLGSFSSGGGGGTIATPGANNFTSTKNLVNFTKSNFFRKAFEKASLSVGRGNQSLTGSQFGSSPNCRLGSPETTLVALICNLYETALNTLTQVKLDILAGLCYQDLILPNLWHFISSLGPQNGMKAFLDHLNLHTKTCAPEFQILILFCDCATHLITILDDMEMYEQQKPFTIEEMIIISSFLNNFVFKIIWNNLIDFKTMNMNNLLNSTHALLMLLYKRDSRRQFSPNDHWLIKDLKVSHFMKDLENGRKGAHMLMQKVPHIIPHKERVVLFRKYVKNEKTVLGLTESACASPHSTLITVHRSRVVEDGYQQLATLPSQSLKGVIRVKFINEQGLDEAGIDQDGVFKEFLEDTIKRVFDPSLNLFRVTTEQRLYPSPTSHIQENHLSLFEFVGKMLGKAVYEGIVVDVPFASFFLSQVLGQQQSALYSSIDELPSLDADLYKSLTYIKHYDGDITQLDLTFSIDEDCMGQIVTHELVTGGRAIPVTKETRISYIHLMAHFRMHTQIHEQTAAFIRGFRSIVNPDWLTMFSTPEFQRLISGDNTPVDLQDLRKHTKYFGGFHNNHRVIIWLWDILEKDFSQEEHKLFLKFVTSCSKQPLLGFAHLEPPFSIRCVEVSDDNDTGDTVGSVLRGFFTFRPKDPINRLPTSSTCFNLLKLPNYQKKSTLREKLRYAIASNTGFELS
ncbi:ubiquitin-protein ligase E3B-like [Oppia nitens]|uniref:ubiquitin-protein ligase E3B-like n=1 Tax=Oppia nitens TaxID=1686743 RepID=UPI0023DC9142|nr:ubiquitin-protein ligase E3B-like [Oppia nitens]